MARHLIAAVLATTIAPAWANPVLQGAEQRCNGYRYGSTDYRRCRGEVWKQLRERCHDLRGQEPFVKASQREQHRRSRELYCDAQERFKIID